MKFTLLLICFLSLSLFADKKWIPIEPIEPIKPIGSIEPLVKEQKSTLDVNISQVLPMQKLHQNAKIIQFLLDNIKEDTQPELEE